MSTTTVATFEIRPRGPFALEQSADFIGGWVKPTAEGAGAAGHLHLAFLLDTTWEPVGVCLQERNGAVHGEIYGGAPARAVAAQVARILSLDVDARDWPAAGAQDPVVAALQARFPGFRPVLFPDAYEAAAWCLISSRITMRQAAAVKDRLTRELGYALSVHGHPMWAFPGPDRLAALEEYPGLFGRKVEYLGGLGRAALRGELDTAALRALPEAEALAHLQRLAGIGPFGAGLIRLREGGAVDELPRGEVRLERAVRLAYGLPDDSGPDGLERIAGGWRPYRTWVAVHLRRQLGEGGGMAHLAGTDSRPGTG